MGAGRPAAPSPDAPGAPHWQEGLMKDVQIYLLDNPLLRQPLALPRRVFAHRQSHSRET